MGANLTICPSCGVPPGSYHRPGCPEIAKAAASMQPANGASVMATVPALESAIRKTLLGQRITSAAQTRDVLLLALLDEIRALRRELRNEAEQQRRAAVAGR